MDNTLEPWVQHNSDLIPEKVEREHQHEDGKAGDNLQQGLLLQHREGLLQHVAPGRGWGLDSHPYKAQRGFGQNGIAHTECALCDDRCNAVRQDVLKDDTEMGHVASLGRGDVVPFTDGERLWLRMTRAMQGTFAIPVPGISSRRLARVYRAWLIRKQPADCGRRVLRFRRRAGLVGWVPVAGWTWR